MTKKSALHDVLVSVYDKSGVVSFVKELQHYCRLRVISTGGTAKTLQGAGIKVTEVADITGFPSLLDGRVKTLHPKIFGGLLADVHNPHHQEEMRAHAITPIDFVIVDLYPFEQTVAKKGVTMVEAMEKVDIGGVALLRAAAKNHDRVVVVFDKMDYPRIIEAFSTTGKVSADLRQELAAKAFAHTAFYDSQIAHYLNQEMFPAELTLPLRKQQELRYGDNPDQKAYLYSQPNNDTPILRLQKHMGRELSATNITDIEAGIHSVRLFTTPAAVVIKHNSPCGIALGTTTAKALERALIADSESAFGGIVVLNSPMTLACAKVIALFKKSGKGQMDIIAAPEITDKAKEILKQVRKSTGIYTFGKLPHTAKERLLFRAIDGGMIVQTENIPGSNNWKVMTEKKPTAQQLKLMHIGCIFIARVRSNTILVIDKELPMTRGIGTGQTSRLLAAQVAFDRAGMHTKGAICLSDGFFPMPDCIELAAERGIAVIVQPGGSINDTASITAANKAGISMVFTGQRLFWH